MNYANNKDNTNTGCLVTTDIVTKKKVIEIRFMFFNKI